jgi:hypothetical protein
VPSKDLVVDIAEIDLNHIVADIDEIRRYNPQRYEAEQLTAIVLEDAERIICVGYKDVTDHEFWVRGHMPGMPIMPGVVMCEAAAQMCSYFTVKYNLLGAPGIIVGLGRPGGHPLSRSRATWRSPRHRLPAAQGAQRRHDRLPVSGIRARANCRRRQDEGSSAAVERSRRAVRGDSLEVAVPLDVPVPR